LDLDEITGWLKNIHKQEIAQEAAFWVRQNDADENGKVTWQEYRESYGLTEGQQDDDFFE